MAIQLAERDEMSVEDQDLCYEVMQSKDTSHDGVFYVGVKTTGVYCRPSCPSRRPRRENVTFYATADECEAAGFRPCKRCTPREVLSDGRPELIREACDYLENDPDAQTTLRPVARKLGVDAEYLRRLFKRTLWVTPREYAASHRALRLRHGLREGASVTTAMYDAGYPSSSRLYEAADKQLGMTPAAYQRGGRGMDAAFVAAAVALVLRFPGWDPLLLTSGVHILPYQVSSAGVDLIDNYNATSATNSPRRGAARRARRIPTTHQAHHAPAPPHPRVRPPSAHVHPATAPPKGPGAIMDAAGGRSPAGRRVRVLLPIDDERPSDSPFVKVIWADPQRTRQRLHVDRHE